MTEEKNRDETTETPENEAEVVSPATPETREETPEPTAAEPTEAEALAEEESPAPADDSTASEPTAQTQPQPPAQAEADTEPVAPVVSQPKPKKKRLPRALRPQKTRVTRTASTTRKPIVRRPKPETPRGRRQERRGVVVSDAMDKTIVVKVESIRSHRRYKKVIRRSTKFHAHDEQNAAHVGDIVRIVETRPLSKTKNWRLAEIVEAAK